MDYPSHAFLTLFKFKGLFPTTLFIINEQWLNELDKLVDSARRRYHSIVFDHCFTDSKSYSALVLELHVVH